MRAVGLLLAAGGTAGTFYAVWAISEKPRARALPFALLGPLALAVAFLGAVLVFVPGFLSG